MKLSRFEGRSIGLAGLTTGGVGKAWKAIADKMFAESYIIILWISAKENNYKNKGVLRRPTSYQG
jgi:hypothetical protein